MQLSIKEFYRSKKGQNIESGKKPAGESHAAAKEGSRKSSDKKPAGESHAAAKGGSRKSSDRDLDKNLPKSVRRRLLFDY